MLKRKAYDTIKDWYDHSDKILLIEGARQVGKTTLIRHFLKENNINYVEFNLLDSSKAREAFNTAKNADQLMLKLTSLDLNANIVDNETVIFIDEIQEANDALTPLKFLKEKTKYKFIVSGSLLGIKMKDIKSIGVGYIQIVKMYPLDFKEFISNIGIQEKTIDYLYDCFINFKEVDKTIHETMIDLFNLYIVVGGMPEAVNTYLASKNIKNVIQVLNYIDSTYLRDISKYDKKDKLLIEDLYTLIPSELNKQNKRMILSSLNSKARFYQYEESFVWLKDSGVGLFTYNVNSLEYPLLLNKERTLFKLFLVDVGLLSTKLLDNNQISILNNQINLNYGSLFEQVVCQELACHGFELFYFNSKKEGEIDFVIQRQGQIIPIEVKSGKDYKRHNAMNNVLNNPSYSLIKKAYVLSNYNLSVENKKIYLPIYMIMFITKDEDNSNLDFKYEVDISKL